MGGSESGHRRRAQRATVELECQCVDAECELIGDRIVNLSADGLLVRTEGGSASVGDTVVVSFRPPRSAVWIDAEARVVRLVTGNRPGAPGVALELTSTGPFERELLAATIERLRQAKRRAPRMLPALPARIKASSVVQRSIITIAPPPARDA